ncbi:2-dehydropantoate 2-reductase [Marinitenerispora sediminis]|uniref:Oxidoreductase n=1 Tax=Marinitenerispora sediminis TaxID=1931232 RepID=A0A368T4D8_9ACTN|nr:2-dehydropantoate 2-reductase [Marinitenerispora sediminis]RCV47500.1 oxidoreductase [Marinitenerispora sediminis]RCV47744.1 oxidoreductase [Marinitenerispora sediminis]RCV58237.1 oxidoreductase [Marinitenerispora sediminis]
MRIAILGAGAIGAYVGAALARGGADVHLIARGAQLAALRAHGVRVTSPRGDFHAHPHATGDPREVGPVDAVFLGLKAQHYAGCGPLLRPLLGPETAVVAAQNGIPWWYFHGVSGPYAGHRVNSVDPDGAVSRTIPVERAVGCVVYAATEIAAPGVIRHLEGTRFSIGEPDGSVSARCRDFSAAMVAGGLKCPIERDLRHDIWVKLMGNIAFNPLSALTRSTMAEICRDATSRELAATMMREALDVAARLGVHTEISVERRLAGAERAGDHRTSTLHDLERGRPMELDAILTAVVELADLTGARVPALRIVNAVATLLNERLSAPAAAGAAPLASAG